MKFLRNWKAKLGSLLVSLLLFWSVHSAQNVDRVLQVRVLKPELPAHLTLAGDIPSFMHVRLSGPGESMDFPFADFKIELSNPKPASGSNIYRAHLIPDLPSSVSAEYQTDVQVHLDRLMVRELPVEPVIELKLEEGFEAGYKYVTPSVIKIEGPADVVARMDRVGTQKLEVSGGDLSYKKRVLIENLPPFVRLAKEQPLSVEFNMRFLPSVLSEEASQRKVTSLEGIPVRCSNTLRGVDMKPLGLDSVVIEIETENERVRSDQFRALVHCPVFFDEESRSIRPAFAVNNLLLRIDDLLDRGNVEILRVLPQSISLQFERKIPKAPPPSRRINRDRQEGFRDFFIP